MDKEALETKKEALEIAIKDVNWRISGTTNDKLILGLAHVKAILQREMLALGIQAKMSEKTG